MNEIMFIMTSVTKSVGDNTGTINSRSELIHDTTRQNLAFTQVTCHITVAVQATNVQTIHNAQNFHATVLRGMEIIQCRREEAVIVAPPKMNAMEEAFNTDNVMNIRVESKF